MSDKKNNPNSRQPGPGFAVPFFVALAVLTAVSFQLSLRPTRSQMEKRDLATFPVFSVEALVEGSYFDDITLWFSDTFPGRETWLQVADYSESFYGHSDISIQGTLPQTDEVPLVMATTAPTEPGDVPETEAAPEIQEDTAPAEAETEAGWGGIDAENAAEILQSATAIQIGDRVFQAQGFTQGITDSYVRAVNTFADAVKDKDVTVVHAIAPTAVGVLIEESFLPNLNSVSQKAILDYMHSGMNEGIITVDTVTPLIQHNSEYIYFNTDHHWTALGAYYFYEALVQALGMEPVKLEDMELWPQGEFIGSLWDKASRPQELQKDYVDAYIPVGDITNTIYTKDGWPSDWPLLTDCTNRDTNAKYMVFGTDFPMTRAENHSLPDGPNVLLIKDSFGNCFVPFLAQNFHNVYAIDYRKYYQLPIKELIEEYDLDYVVFMPNMTATQATEGPAMFRRVTVGGG